MNTREQIIEELKYEIENEFRGGDKVSKADIGRVLDACVRKQGFEHLYGTRIYRNYGGIYCHLLEEIHRRDKQGMLKPLQEELLSQGRPRMLYGVTIPINRKRVDVYVYKTREEAEAQNMRKETVIRGVRLGEVNNRGYKKTLKTMRERAYCVERGLDTSLIRNRMLTYLVEGNYKVEII